jgi:hypothetical protein
VSQSVTECLRTVFNGASESTRSRGVEGAGELRGTSGNFGEVRGSSGNFEAFSNASGSDGLLRVCIERRRTGPENFRRTSGELPENFPNCWMGGGAGQATRAISTARLHVLPRVHLPPIDVVVCYGPSETRRSGSVHLGGGFPLRCFQRLSLPDVATRRCPWRNNRYTSGRSIPVLSY